MKHMCRATFEIEKAFQIGGQSRLELLLLGSGYASFPGVSLYEKFDTRAMLANNTVPMEWETNHCYAGNVPALGLASCIVNVRGKSANRSQVMMISTATDRLFPAIMVNSLFVDLSFERVPVKMFNKDPITLRGSVRNLDPIADLRVDPRAANNNLAGFTEALRGGLKAADFFEPTGTQRLVAPVRFYDRQSPDTLVATLVSSEVQSLPHYGLEITPAAMRRDGKFVSTEFSIRNLTGAPVDLVWYVDDSHDLSIVSPKEGRVRAGSEAIRIEVRAVSAAATTVAERACLFCGAHNTPATAEQFAANPVSGFALVETDAGQAK